MALLRWRGGRGFEPHGELELSARLEHDSFANEHVIAPMDDHQMLAGWSLDDDGLAFFGGHPDPIAVNLDHGVSRDVLEDDHSILCTEPEDPASPSDDEPHYQAPRGDRRPPPWRPSLRSDCRR